MVNRFFPFLVSQRWNIEEPKFTTTNAAMSSGVIKQMEVASKEPRTEKNVADTTKPEVSETNMEKQTEKLVSLEKRVEVCNRIYANDISLFRLSSLTRLSFVDSGEIREDPERSDGNDDATRVSRHTFRRRVLQGDIQHRARSS